jgi:transcriptional regulator with XRE-family HTH domain
MACGVPREEYSRVVERTDDAARAAIARRIREARERLGLRVVDVAKALGVQWNTPQRYETGEMLPSGQRLVQLAAILKVTPEWIQHGDARMEPLGGLPPEILAALDRLEDRLLASTVTKARSMNWSGGAPRSAEDAVAYLLRLDKLERGLAEPDEIAAPEPREGRRKLPPKAKGSATKGRGR